jgi:nucleoside-diphosphate-sugar epimerase
MLRAGGENSQAVTGPGRRILLTGASGYLGSLIAASLLAADPQVRIVAPARPRRDPAAVIAPIAGELMALAGRDAEAELGRLQIVPLPDELGELDPVLRTFGVDEVIHCAGCLDYFNKAALEAVNVEFTRALLGQATRLGVGRFIHVSTAYSSGYVEHDVAEALHREPQEDPTHYTVTKRAGERLVAGSGLPYLILRPSIVIGHSEDGRYSGKRYGLYQLWSGIERLLCREWHDTIHAFAPDQPANLVHQDAFQNAFLAAWRQLPDDTIVNIVSSDSESPSVRELWDLWLGACNRPRRTVYYQRMADIPVREIPSAQRALLALASVNLQIIGHRWRFETTQLDRLRQQGLVFPQARVASVEICQRRLIESSAAIQKFLAKRDGALLAAAQ